MNAQERVANGVAWLNETIPQWWTKIDLKTFDIRRPCDCVLGQTCANLEGEGMFGYNHGYWKALQVLVIETRIAGTKIIYDWVEERGFASTDSNNCHEDYVALQEEWVKIITALQNPPPPVPTVPERVARGVQWLDENVPDWPDRIVIKTFDIREPCRCVIGQLYGNYNVASCNRFPEGVRGCDLGFDWNWLPCTDPDLSNEDYDRIQEEEYQQLQAEWTRVITLRQQRARAINLAKKVGKALAQPTAVYELEYANE